MRACRALRTCLPLIAAALLVLAAAIPVQATTLIRSGLESLTAQNELAVYGRVLDIYSYWDAAHTSILTDVRFKPAEVLKGTLAASELKLTLVGGTVGSTTTLLIGAPTLVPGHDYVVFASQTDLLPDQPPVMTVPDHIQGVFDVVTSDPGSTAIGTRAVSQALIHPLLPDAAGITDVPGGEQGYELKEMFSRVRELAARGNTEVR
jgi:hypothetical protein